MKKLFLKTMLLLSALVAGNGSAWATEYEKVMECDLTTKTVGCSAYNTTTTYGDWKIVNGANNNKGWAYFKMGGKSATLADANPCYIYSTKATEKSVDKITVHLPSGSLTNNSMSVNSWGVYVYSDAEMTSEIDYVEGGTITNSEGSFDFTPSTSVTWEAGYYYKVSWNLGNTSTTNGIVYVDKITLYKEKVSYNITAASNDTSLGTVALEGNVITATSAVGCRLSASNPYTVSPAGSATVDQSGNVFTVTPSANTTVTINFEAIPTHTITAVASPVAGGTVSAASSLYEGGETTITASANSGYKFTGWSVSGEGASLSSKSEISTTLTMGTADVTVTATFAVIKYNEISWSVNGKVVKTENIEDGEAITFAAPASAIPTGFVFTGWVADEIDTPTDTEPSYVTSATSTADITYYAVFAKGTEATVWKKLSVNNLNNEGEGTYAIITPDGHAFSGAISSGHGGVTTSAFSFTSNIAATAPEGTCELTLTAVTGGFTVYDAVNKKYLYASKASVGNLSWHNTENSYWRITNAGSASNFVYNSNSAYLRSYSNGSFRTYSGASNDAIAFVKKVQQFNYSDYHTNLPATVTVTVGSKGFATLTSDYSLDFTDKSIQAYTISSTDGSALILTQKNEVAAGEPVLLYSETASDSQDIPVIETADADDTNKLVRGDGSAITWSDSKKVYILYTGGDKPGFFRANNSVVAEAKAYLDLTGLSADTRSFSLDFGGEAQGIETVNCETINNNRYSDLLGRSVVQPTKGLYIVNGKKIVVK